MRCYFIKPDPDECEGYSIVAKTAKEAKKLAWKLGLDLYGWIDIRVLWQRGVDVSGLKEGHVIEPLEGLKIGCYSWAGLKKNVLYVER
jgi:hypothetical protein